MGRNNGLLKFLMQVLLKHNKVVLKAGKVVLGKGCCCKPICKGLTLKCDQVSASKTKCGRTCCIDGFQSSPDNLCPDTECPPNVVGNSQNCVEVISNENIYAYFLRADNQCLNSGGGGEPPYPTVTGSLTYNLTCLSEFDYTIDGYFIYCFQHGACATLTNEYTTDMLISNTIDALPAFDGDFNDACEAFRFLEPNGISYTISRFNYKFVLKKSKKENYYIFWSETFTPESGKKHKSRHKTVLLAGQTETDTYTVDEPEHNGSITITDLKCTSKPIGDLIVKWAGIEASVFKCGYLGFKKREDLSIDGTPAYRVYRNRYFQYLYSASTDDCSSFFSENDIHFWDGDGSPDCNLNISCSLSSNYTDFNNPDNNCSSSESVPVYLTDSCQAIGTCDVCFCPCSGTTVVETETESSSSCASGDSCSLSFTTGNYLSEEFTDEEALNTAIGSLPAYAELGHVGVLEGGKTMDLQGHRVFVNKARYKFAIANPIPNLRISWNVEFFPMDGSRKSVLEHLTTTLPSNESTTGQSETGEFELDIPNDWGAQTIGNPRAFPI